MVAVGKPIIDHRLGEEPAIRWIGVFLIFLTPALGGFIYGYDIGVTSFVLSIMLSGNEVDDNSWWTNGFFQWQQGMVVSAVSLGALAGSHLVLVYLSQTVSRRMELRIASLFYLTGILFNVASGSIFRSDGLLVLVAGRFLFGMGVGCVMRELMFPLCSLVFSHCAMCLQHRRGSHLHGRNVTYKCPWSNSFR